MRIPEDKIDEIRSSVDIVDVIGSTVRLKKAGKNFQGLCPFHTEKTPSFMVNPEKQIFKCFGCGAGGNVFSFIMKDQNVTFYEAVKQMADKAGISLPRMKEDAQERRDLEKYYAVNEFAAKWYANNLWKSTAGKHALEYLRKRGFRDETLRDFNIGFALDGWEGLVHAASKASFGQDALLESGLALQKTPRDTPYDRFRNRIIFPIQNQFGRIVGFGARKFDDSEGPKYINSPESPVYHKGRLLYGLFQNKDTVRKHDIVILVEGYTDVMALYEYGVKLGVATLGTSMTPNQAQLINRHTKNVVLLYDADVPGIKAALRGAEVLFGANLNVHVVNLGENADPDSFLRQNPVEAFYEKMKNRQSIIEFYASSFRDRGGELPYDEKTRRIREMIDLIDNVRDRLQREIMLQEVGEKLSADVKTIFKEYYRKKRSKARYRGRQEPPGPPPEKVSIAVEIEPAERDLARLLINEPAIAAHITQEIEEADIHNENIVKLYKIVKKLSAKAKDYTPADLVTAAGDSVLNEIIPGLSLAQYEMNGDKKLLHERIDLLAEGVVARLKARGFDAELADVQEAIRKAESTNSDTKDLILKYQELLSRKNSLTHKSDK